MTTGGTTEYRAPNPLRERFPDYVVSVKQIRTTGEHTAFLVDPERLPDYEGGRPLADPRDFGGSNDSDDDSEDERLRVTADLDEVPASGRNRSTTAENG